MKLDIVQHYSVVEDQFNDINYNELIGSRNFGIEGSSIEVESKNEQGRLSYIVSEVSE